MRKILFACSMLFLLAFTHQAMSQPLLINIKDVGTVEITIEKFSPQEHVVKKCGDYICFIDGNLAFGSDGNLPDHIITRMLFKRDSSKTMLDISGMFNPQINEDNKEFHITGSHYWGDLYKIHAQLSDGAGAYFVEWVVSKEGSTRTHIGDYESLQELLGQFDEIPE
jgi:hypothetical protein